MAAEYPTGIKTFTTKDPGDPIQSSHINDLQDEVKAVETQLVTSKLATLTTAPAANNVLTTDGSGNPTWGGAWVNWTPTVTFEGGTTDPSSITKVSARYMQIGKTIIANADYFFGAGGDREIYNFTLPVAPTNDYGAASASESIKIAFTQPIKATIFKSGTVVKVYVPLQDKAGHVMFSAIYEAA